MDGLVAKPTDPLFPSHNQSESDARSRGEGRAYTKREAREGEGKIKHEGYRGGKKKINKKDGGQEEIKGQEKSLT